MMMVAGISIELDPHFFAMMAIVFIAGIIRGFAGFGSALLAVPALAVLYGPAQAIVIEVLIEIPVVLGMSPIAIREAKRETVQPMLLMFVAFVPLGTLLLTIINPDHVKVLISLFVLIAVGLMSQQSRFIGLFTPKADYIVGAISGAIQGLTGMAGPLFATALAARGESATITRANTSAIAGGVIFFSVISFALFGLITKQALLYAVIASPAILSGVWLGSVLFRRFTHRNVQNLIFGFLVFTALLTLYQTLT